MWSDLADVLARGITLQKLSGSLGLALGLLCSQQVSFLFFLVLSLTCLCQSFCPLSFLILYGLLPPSLALHVLLALLLFSNLLALNLLPCIALVFDVV